MLQIMVFGFVTAAAIKSIKFVFALRDSNILLAEDYTFVNSCVDEETQFGEQLLQ